MFHTFHSYIISIITAEECLKKWTTIKENLGQFHRRQRKLPSGSHRVRQTKYKYEQELSFLPSVEGDHEEGDGNFTFPLKDGKENGAGNSNPLDDSFNFSEYLGSEGGISSGVSSPAKSALNLSMEMDLDNHMKKKLGFHSKDLTKVCGLLFSFSLD